MRSLAIRASICGTLEGIGLGWLLAVGFHSPKNDLFETIIALFLMAMAGYLFSRLKLKD